MFHSKTYYLRDHKAGQHRINRIGRGLHPRPGVCGPKIGSNLRADPNPTSAASVNFTVTFSESVTGVDVSDFSLTKTGVSGATVSGVSGSGSVYTVTVNTAPLVSGVGTIRLDVVDNNSIVDAASNPLGGVGLSDGSYTSGETYDVRFYRAYIPLVLKY